MSTKLRIKVRDRWYNVEVGDLHATPVQVLVDGFPVEVSIEGPADNGAPDSPEESPVVMPATPEHPRARPAAAARVFRCPMPGLVVSVSVRVGDQVVTGDEVCVLEAMKMHQTLRADWSGVVGAVHVEPGQQVLDGDPIIELRE